jgi:hypothetical protein
MRKSILFPVLLVLVLLVFVGLFLWGDSLNDSKTEDNNETENVISGNGDVDDEQERIELIEEECVKLGCEEGSVYIGSKNSNKFYMCDCRWAETISSENIVCFKTAQEALDDGRVESVC